MRNEGIKKLVLLDGGPAARVLVVHRDCGIDLRVLLLHGSQSLCLNGIRVSMTA